MYPGVYYNVDDPLLEPQKSLVEALENRDFKAAQKALDDGADINAPVGSSSKDHVLLKAIDADDTYRAQWIIKRIVDSKGSLDIMGRNPATSPLNKAIDKKNMEIVRALVEAGADVNFPLCKASEKNVAMGLVPYDLPLALAAKNGNEPAMDYLLQKGADPRAYSRGGATPLYSACSLNRLRAACILLGKGVQIDEAFDGKRGWPSGGPLEKKSPLHDICTHAYRDYQKRQPKLRVLEALLDAGANPDAKNHVNKTPLELSNNYFEDEAKEDFASLFTRYKSYAKFADLDLKRLQVGDLFKLGGNGYCLLDSPDIWKHFGEITEALAAKGQTISAQSLKAQNKDGVSLFQRGVECFKTSEILTYLLQNEKKASQKFSQGTQKAPQGSHLIADLFEVKSHQGNSLESMSPVLRIAAQRAQLQKLFDIKVWTGRQTGELTEVWNGLPDFFKEDVKGYPDLRTRLSRENSTPGRGR